FMMRIRIIIMLLIALFVESRQEAFGQTTDTLSLSDKVIRTASFATGFRGEIWQNPALYYYYTPYTWTRLDVNGAYHDKGKASLKQEGDKDTRIGVDVNSFVILSERDRVFGSAGYRSEKQENVLWNENIDWKLIAPYVTGDSIGGFLKGELIISMEVTPVSQVPGHGESPVVTERLIIIGIKIRVHVIQLPISLLLWEQDIVWGHIVWEFPQISGFISRKVRFHFLQIKALLRYTICWDWAWIMCVSPETRPGRSIKASGGEE